MLWFRLWAVNLGSTPREPDSLKLSGLICHKHAGRSVNIWLVHSFLTMYQITDLATPPPSAIKASRTYTDMSLGLMFKNTVKTRKYKLITSRSLIYDVKVYRVIEIKLKWNWALWMDSVSNHVCLLCHERTMAVSWGLFLTYFIIIIKVDLWSWGQGHWCWNSSAIFSRDDYIMNVWILHHLVLKLSYSQDFQHRAQFKIHYVDVNMQSYKKSVQYSKCTVDCNPLVPFSWILKVQFNNCF